MLAIERRKAIVELVKKDGSVQVSMLSSDFAVSEETIRRDLEELEKRGLLVRTHGGAVSIDEDLPNLSAEVRETLNAKGKKKIAAKACGLIKQGDTIFLDASTTVFFLAAELKKISGITVITNSIKVINELCQNKNITAICTGGAYENTDRSFVGNMAVNNINSFYADKCFISCAGLTAEGGMLEHSEDEAVIKKGMIDNSEQVILLCDRTKFGRIRSHRLAALNEADILITDVDAVGVQERKIVESFQQAIFVGSAKGGS